MIKAAVVAERGDGGSSETSIFTTRKCNLSREKSQAVNDINVVYLPKLIINYKN